MSLRCHCGWPAAATAPGVVVPARDCPHDVQACHAQPAHCLPRCSSPRRPQQRGLFVLRTAKAETVPQERPSALTALLCAPCRSRQQCLAILNSHMHSTRSMKVSTFPWCLPVAEKGCMAERICCSTSTHLLLLRPGSAIAPLSRPGMRLLPASAAFPIASASPHSPRQSPTCSPCSCASCTCSLPVSPDLLAPPHLSSTPHAGHLMLGVSVLCLPMMGCWW